MDFKGYHSQKGPGAGQSGSIYGTGPTGGSYGGRGGRGFNGLTTSTAYGTLYFPELYGSGGGGRGGRGGGVIRLEVSNMLRLEGRLKVNGEKGSSNGGGGTGGSVLIQTNHFDGEGSIEVNGGDGIGNAGGGAGGRIALYHSGFITYLGTYQAYGGRSSAEIGGAGSIYIENRRNTSKLYRSLRIDNQVPTKRNQLIGEVNELNLTGNQYTYPYYMKNYTAANGVTVSTTGTPYCARTDRNDSKKCSSDSSYLGNIFQSSGFYYTTETFPAITYRFPTSLFLEYIEIYPACSSSYLSPYQIRVYEDDDLILKSRDWVDTAGCLQGQPGKMVVKKMVSKVSVLSFLIL